MFNFFKKKKISKYLQPVENYVSANFVPESATGIKYSARDVRYSLSEVSPKEDVSEVSVQYSTYIPPKQPAKGKRWPKSNPSNRYSSQETDRDNEIRYSSRDSSDKDIPNLGDRFHALHVKSVMKREVANWRADVMARDLDSHLNLSFVDMLVRYINKNGWRDSRVYKAAQIDRRLFSKIMSDRNYKPSKDTALALAIALELSLDQTNDLLSRAGYVLSHSSKRDVIIEYFIREKIYNLSDINEVLYRLDQKIIGR